MTEVMSPATPTAESLTDLMRQLAEARGRADQCMSVYMAAFEAWKDEHAPLIQAATDAKCEVADLESRVRLAAVAEFERTGSKKLAHGVGIRVTRKLDYDPGRAFEWAKDHHMALQLDRREFENLMKATVQRPAWVHELEVPTATLPTAIDIEGLVS